MYCCPSLCYFCPKRPSQSLIYYVCFVNIIPDRVTPFRLKCQLHFFGVCSDQFIPSPVEPCDGQKATVTIFRNVNESASPVISSKLSLFFQSLLYFIKINRYFLVPLAFIPFSRGIQFQFL